MKETRKLLDIMAQLRHPETGCPWDLRQDFSSLIPYTLEEAYEVVDAIERGDYEDLREELGDLLLQVAFHSQMAQERELFDFEDVARSISDKLVRRHPHVFGETVFENDAQRQQYWENSKQLEKQEKTGEAAESILDGIASSLPALVRAQKLQERAARHGFDWDAIHPVFDKVEEELRETREAYASGDRRHLEEELGDLLFVVVNLARHLDLDAETALRACNRKFSARFGYIEEQLRTDGVEVVDAGVERLEELWDEAKGKGVGKLFVPSPAGEG